MQKTKKKVQEPKSNTRNKKNKKKINIEKNLTQVNVVGAKANWHSTPIQKRKGGSTLLQQKKLQEQWH